MQRGVSKKLQSYVPANEPKTEELESDERSIATDVIARWGAVAHWFSDLQEFQITDIREGAPVASD